MVPDKVAAVQSILDRYSSASAREIGRYTEAQLALISDFLTKMEQVTKEEAESLRETPETGEDGSPTASEHSAPIGGLREARLALRSGLSLLRLRAGTDASELYRAAFEGATPQVRLRDGRVLVQYRGLPFDWRKRTATFGLNPAIPWTVELVGGIQKIEADLRAIELRSFDLTGGAERIQLELNRPTGEMRIRIVGGVKTIRLERPTGVPVRLSVQGGSGGVSLDGVGLGRKGGESVLESPGWSGARDRIDVAVVGGSKSIEVVRRA